MTKKIFVAALAVLLAIMLAIPKRAVDTNQAKSTTPVVAVTTAYPMPTVIPTRASELPRASRSSARPLAKEKPAVKKRTVVKPKQKVQPPKKRVVKAKPKPSPKRVEPKSNSGGVAACIRKYESGGNYHAQNPSSSASGAYQFIDSTWQALTGLPGSAKDYPPSMQDAAFWKLWNHGSGAHHWLTAGRCGY